MAAEEDRLRQMIREFGRALSEALSDSSEAYRSLREIREEGYTFYLLLGNLDEEEATECPEAVRLHGDRSEIAAPGHEPPPDEPPFRINGSDLAFLRSVGIDPTRKVKSRRGRS